MPTQPQAQTSAAKDVLHPLALRKQEGSFAVRSPRFRDSESGYGADGILVS